MMVAAPLRPVSACQSHVVVETSTGMRMQKQHGRTRQSVVKSCCQHIVIITLDRWCATVSSKAVFSWRIHSLFVHPTRTAPAEASLREFGQAYRLWTSSAVVAPRQGIDRGDRPGHAGWLAGPREAAGARNPRVF